MKRYLVLIGAFLVVLVAAWSAFGQREGGQGSSTRGQGRAGFGMFQLLSAEEAAKLREEWPNMSEEERKKFRAQMREKWENMSEEEKEKLMSQMRQRFSSRVGGMRPEDQQKAIKAIEEQLAKLKGQTQVPRPEGGFQNLSEEERTKFREQMMKYFQDRQKALQIIITQVAGLQGRRQPPAEGENFLIISTNDLKPIQEAATKEKAKETAQLLERLIARGSGRRGFGGRPPGAGGRGGSERSTGRR